jgi:hypothetical protein
MAEAEWPRARTAVAVAVPFRRPSGQPPTHGGAMLTRVLRTVQLDTIDWRSAFTISWSGFELSSLRQKQTSSSTGTAAASRRTSSPRRSPRSARSTGCRRTSTASAARSRGSWRGGGIRRTSATGGAADGVGEDEGGFATPRRTHRPAQQPRGQPPALAQEPALAVAEAPRAPCGAGLVDSTAASHVRGIFWPVCGAAGRCGSRAPNLRTPGAVRVRLRQNRNPSSLCSNIGHPSRHPSNFS